MLPENAQTAEIDRIASVLRGHWPDPVSGCECAPIDEETGVKERLRPPWERHVAELLTPTGQTGGEA